MLNFKMNRKDEDLDYINDIKIDYEDPACYELDDDVHFVTATNWLDIRLQKNCISRAPEVLVGTIEIDENGVVTIFDMGGSYWVDFNSMSEMDKLMNRALYIYCYKHGIDSTEKMYQLEDDADFSSEFIQFTRKWIGENRGNFEFEKAMNELSTVPEGVPDYFSNDNQLC